MLKKAHDIIIKNEVKEDFIYDFEGNKTDEIYTFREFEIIDEEGVILEVMRYTEENPTKEELLQSRGIVLGLSAWWVE